MDRALLKRPPPGALLALPAALALAHLAVFAWRFADERLFADSGYYLARVINECSFRIEHGRWVLALAEALPLAGAKLGLGLPALIVLHSLGNVAWMAACMAAAWRLRDPAAVLAIALLHTVGLADGLFCPVFELYYAADLLAVILALQRRPAALGRWNLPAQLALGALVASSHAVGFLLLAAMLAMSGRAMRQRQGIAWAALLAAVAAARLLTVSQYEKESAAFLLKALQPGAVAELFTAAHGAGLLRYAAAHYPDALLLGALALAGLALHRDRWRLLLFAAFLALLLGLIGLKMPGWLHDRYREQVDFGATAWVVLVLAFHAPDGIRMRWAIAAAALLVIGLRAHGAYALAPHYAERTATIEAAIAQARAEGRSKGIIPAPRYFGPPDHAIDLGWSVPVESLLLSAKAGPAATVSIITAQDSAHEDVARHLHQLVFRRWEVMPDRWLAPRWFTPPVGTYEALAPFPSPPPRPPRNGQ